MRVIAGTARSLQLKVQPGLITRPTTDRIKETLFNMLMPVLQECIFVDLFSGSGAIGIEALSRGASQCYFVENNKTALTILQENLCFTRLDKKAIVIKQDVFSALSNFSEPKADVIFMDPPYERSYEKQVLTLLATAPFVTLDTLIVAEASLSTDFSFAEELGFTVKREKKYKTNQHVFLKKRQKGSVSL